MISVVIATRNQEEALARTLSSLVPAAAEGIVREVVVVDGGSQDGTLHVADATGCDILAHSGPVGARLLAGADATTRGDWLLFLTPGAVLDVRWEAEAANFVERAMRSGRADQHAAVFRLALDDIGAAARLSEIGAAVNGVLFGVPHPGQGLLIKRSHYRRLGGHRPLSALEDVDLVRRIGRRRVQRLRAAATLLRLPGDEIPPRLVAARRTLSRLLAALALPTALLARLHG